MKKLASIHLLGLCLMGCGSTLGPYQSMVFPVQTTQPNPTVSPTPQVITLAGAGEAGNLDAQGTNARFANPANVELDGQGNVYVADFDNDQVRKIAADLQVTTLVSRADFQRPFGLTMGRDGMLYVETDANDQGQRDGTTGTIWRVNPTSGAATVVMRNLGRPRGLCTLTDGRLVLVNLTTNVVEILDPSVPSLTPLAGQSGVPGFSNGIGTAAHFDRAYGPAIGPGGVILLADQNNNCIRSVNLNGQVSTFAGTGQAGKQDGPRLAATFDHPQDVSTDSAGNVYVSDNNNHTIRLIDPLGNVSVLAGDGVAGFQDGPLLQAEFFGQEGLAASADGKRIVVADGSGGGAFLFNRVRLIAFP